MLQRSGNISGGPRWSFWREAERIETFKSTTIENVVFLLKWLALAHVIEALMLRIFLLSGLRMLWEVKDLERSYLVRLMVLLPI